MCETCGSTEVLHQPELNRYLERDLKALFEDKIPRWRWLKRRAYVSMIDHIDRVCAELRDETRF